MPPVSKLAARREEIRTLYLQGLSTTAIAALIGNCTYGAIGWLVRDIVRPRAVAIALSKPPQSVAAGASRARARGVMRRHLGRPLARHEHVHHKDGDWTNNTLENLLVLDAGEHARHHARLRGRRPLCAAVCAWCGQGFFAHPYKPQRSCSRRCAAYVRARQRQVKQAQP